jgi:hypothetical protein
MATQTNNRIESFQSGTFWERPNPKRAARAMFSPNGSKKKRKSHVDRQRSLRNLKNNSSLTQTKNAETGYAT